MDSDLLDLFRDIAELNSQLEQQDNHLQSILIDEKSPRKGPPRMAANSSSKSSPKMRKTKQKKTQLEPILVRKEPLPQEARSPSQKRLVPMPMISAREALKPKPTLRSDFMHHRIEIEKLMNQITESSEEAGVLQEVNDLVSIVLTQSQNHLENADNTLRNGEVRPPAHYQKAIEKLLNDETRTNILVVDKPTKREIPVFKKMHIKYTDTDKDDLDTMLLAHYSPDEDTSSTSYRPQKPYTHDTLPDVIVPVSRVPKTTRQLPPDDADFDLSLYSPVNIITKAQKSLGSVLSQTNSLSPYSSPNRTETNMSHLSTLVSQSSASPSKPTVPLSSSSSSFSPQTKRSIAATRRSTEEDELDRMVKDILARVSQQSEAAEAANGTGSEDLDQTLTINTSATKAVYDEDLLLLTPSLYGKSGLHTHQEVSKDNSADDEEDPDLRFDMELIRNSSRNERELLQGRVNSMKSRLDLLLGDGDAAGMASLGHSGDVVHQVLSSARAPQDDDEQRLDAHSHLLHKVVRALMKKKNEKKDKRGKDPNRKSKRLGSKIVSDGDNTNSGSSNSNHGNMNMNASEGSSRKRTESNESTQSDSEITTESPQLTPMPPLTEMPSFSSPRSIRKQLAQVSSLSTMQEVDEEQDDQSVHSKSERKPTRQRGAKIKLTEKALAAKEAVRERTQLML